MQTPQRQSPGTQNRQYCFGDFTLDLDHGFLFRRGEEVPLRPKSLEVLTYLVERHGRLVGKEELIAAVWPDTAATDNSLAQCLLEIRRALGDDSQQFIRTVPRRGYVFKLPVAAPVIERPVLAEAVPLRRKLTFARLVLALLVFGAVTSWLAWKQLSSPAPAHLEFTQLTNFPDSVHSPALSKDGKLLAFIRGNNHGWVGEPGELYLKLLPNGQPFALTQDGKLKMAPTFTPDNSQIVYTSEGWTSFSVPITGEVPALFMANATGITWIGPKRILFSEIRDSPRMAVVTATEERADKRDVYVPASRQGMAHFSYLSPDKRWVLVAEMLTNTGWTQCRVVPFDGSSSRGKQVGPPGSSCTSAAWSPDGRWMYFAAQVQGESHLWRQRFPNGPPEQLTSGLNEEQDVVADPDGRSLITAVIAGQSTVWYHDESGDRPVSVEGYAYRPQVTNGGTKVYYLVRRGRKGSFPIGELWSRDLASGRNERLLPDFLVRFFQVSRDGRRVVFDTFDQQGRSRLWLASTDGSEPPRKLTPAGDVEEERAFFGASGDIYFMREPPDMAYLSRMKPDGSQRRQLSGPITFLVNISPDEKWACCGVRAVLRCCLSRADRLKCSGHSGQGPSFPIRRESVGRVTANFYLCRPTRPVQRGPLPA